MNSSYDIASARGRIAEIALLTPVMQSPWLSDHTGARVDLKLECLQRTGSFKLRGAANKLLGLDAEQRRRGVAVCSSGNHGLATAFVAARLGITATVCVPEWVDPVKLAAIRKLGARAVVIGDTMEAAEEESLRLASGEGLEYVHPFDDPEVIAGQGTLGAEITEQVAGVGTVLVPLSGGGLIAGVALAVKAAYPAARIVGVSAAAAPVMARSVAAGALVRLPEVETVANALAGNLGRHNHHTLRLVAELVDEFVEVTEPEIEDAMRRLYAEHRLLVEGGGAVAVAALLNQKAEPKGAVTAVVSGGNVDLDRFSAIAGGL
jgi:threonine dehydratase